MTACPRRRPGTLAAALAIAALSAACGSGSDPPAATVRPAAAAAPAATTPPAATNPPAAAPARLGAAREVAGKFTALYGTLSWRQPRAAWLAQLAPLDTPGLQARLAAAAARRGHLARGETKLTSSAAVAGIRSVTGTSVTFTVRVVTTTTTATAASGGTAARDYAVTVTRTAGKWRASGISPVPSRPGRA